MTISVLPIAWAKAITTSWHVVTSVTPQTMRCTPSTHTFSSMPLIWMMSFFTSGTRHQVSRMHSALIAAWTGKTKKLCCYTYIRNHFTKALPLSLILAPNTEMIFYISIRLPAPLSVYDTLRVFTTPADWQMVSFGSCCRQGGFGHCRKKVLLSACWHRPQIRQ